MSDEGDDRNERYASIDEVLMDRFGGPSESESKTSETSLSQDASDSPEASDTSSTSTSSGSTNTNETDKVDKTTNLSQTSKTPIGERKQVMLYLRKGVADRLNLVEDKVALAWKREFGTELERNPHIRPLVLERGMEGVREMSAEEIREYLIDAEQLNDPPQ
jgi:hypothetical protein